LPIYKEIEKAAANAKILYGDDTWVRIQELKKKNKGKKKGERVGMYTTGIVTERIKGVKIALYLNGRRHTGENVARLLEKREKNHPKVIRMGDAARVNWSTEQESEDCACLAHARRKFAELEKTHPRACGYVLNEIGKIYENEAVARQMSDEDRLAHHEKLSLPILSGLRQWMKGGIEDKRVESNAGLGKAMAYYENQYEMLVQFCRILGAPIDNNVVERALKAPVMIRKNSYETRPLTGQGSGNRPERAQSGRSARQGEAKEACSGSPLYIKT
jgi:transposase